MTFALFDTAIFGFVALTPLSSSPPCGMDALFTLRDDDDDLYDFI